MLKDMAPQKYQDKDRNRPSQTLITKDELQEESPSLATFPWPQPILSTHWMGICTRQKPMSWRYAPATFISDGASSPTTLLSKLPMLNEGKTSFPTSCFQKFGSNICCWGWRNSRSKLLWHGCCASSGSVQSTTSTASTTSTSTAVAGTVGALKTWMERTTRTWVNTAVLSGRSLTSKQKVQPSQSLMQDMSLDRSIRSIRSIYSVGANLLELPSDCCDVAC